ncbi:hypothetical protein [Flavobacterium mekongense]|uniref:hypothetical protein n=1 Tax=Flavobacterium mekongense TaxID=3379707 RepID=UPI00399B4D8F
MKKTDYISGTEDAYSKEAALIKVQVSVPTYSEKSIGVLVDLIFDENGKYVSSSRLEWFPKSLCRIEKIEPKDPAKELPSYFLLAPEWLLNKKKVNFKKN